MKSFNLITLSFLLVVLGLTGCATNNKSTTNLSPEVLAAESFLADITQQVAGDRLSVDVLVPAGTDPHAFQATPQDVARLENAKVLVLNGGGLEQWLDPLMIENDKQIRVIASDGLEPVIRDLPGETGHGKEGDPHFWLDPNLVITYVNNISDGLSIFDPQGKSIYETNADAYIQELKNLDTWITQQVSLIPPENRILVTNHESLGYFADRYGFKVAGTIIPSVSSEAAPSASDLADLIGIIQKEHVRAIFIETGANTDLADQIASETGVKVVSDIYTHSITTSTGNAGSYIEMMKYDTLRIVDALKENKK
jgi:ABC-type Zn uptake system ZnuABC Zn-binding protein ZnuA